MKSLRDQLIEKGLVQIPEEKRETVEPIDMTWHELPRFEMPPPLRTAPSASVPLANPSITCRLCGRDMPETMMVKVDECALCTEEVEERVRGQMEWVHKSVPVLHIEGRALTTPEEYAKMRRR